MTLRLGQMALARGNHLIVLPIDTVRRDLVSRLMLGRKLLDKGFNVFIGYPDEAYRTAIRNQRALYVGRFGTIAGSPQDFQFLDALAAAGGRMLYLHDEGAFYYREHYMRYLKMLHPLRLLSHGAVSRICCWGSRQAQVVGDMGSDLAEKVYVTGMYRFSTLRSQKNRSGPKAKRPTILLMGRYSEVNTSPHDVRPFSDESFAMYKRAEFSADGSADEALTDMRRSWRKSVREWAAFIDLTECLSSELQEYDVVIRPHPAEDWTTYEKVFANVSNVSLDIINDVHESISRADYVVHTECTTGVEAQLIGKTVISYRPYAGLDADYEILGARSAGLLAMKPEEVVQIVTGSLASPKNSQDTEILDLLADCNEGFDSLETIVNLLLEESEAANEKVKNNLALAPALSSYNLRLRVRSFARFLKGRLLSQEPLLSKYLEENNFSLDAVKVGDGGIWLHP